MVVLADRDVRERSRQSVWLYREEDLSDAREAALKLTGHTLLPLRLRFLSCVTGRGPLEH